MCSALFSQVISQWRGPERDGVYPNETLLKQWPNEGPRMIWSSDGFHEGFSSPAVTGQRIYLTGMKDGRGYLFALDLDGKQVWVREYGSEWDEGHAGSRGTATVVGNKIYLMSGDGMVYCFDEKDGKVLWNVDLVGTFGARNLRWGMTESLLIDGNRLFCTPGGRNVMMAILDRTTGKTLQKIPGNGEKSSYCSPVIVEHGKRRLLLTMTGESLVGVDADTGEYLWSYPHRTRYDINPNTPLYHNGYIYSVSGYDTGGQLFKVTGNADGLENIWADETLDSQMGSAMLVDGYVYGSGHSNKGWHCIDFMTGDVQYTARDLGRKGNIIYSDGMFYCYSEDGDVGLVKPNPKKFEVISSFKIDQGSGAHWAHPVIKNGVLYIRHGEVLMAFDISGKK
jgi:outer membrane protein assembly factor BamB